MLATVQQLGEEVAKLAASSWWSLSDHDLPAYIRAADRIEQAAAALKMCLAQQADANSTAAKQGHRNLASWLQCELLLDSTPARQLAKQVTLFTDWPDIAQAVIDGRASMSQATAIATTVDGLPAMLAAVDALNDGGEVLDAGKSRTEIVREAQDKLLDLASDFPVRGLRRLGKRILHHVAPETAVRADELALRRQEGRTFTKRGFTLSKPDDDGLVRVTGALTIEDTAIINAALQPLCTPRPGDERTAAQKRADALVAVCQLSLRTGELPEHGGEPAQCNVTVPYDTVKGQLGVGTLENGEQVSAETARRLACDALILPHLLGSAGQVLDAGRAQRTAGGPLRRALDVRDRGCTFPGCNLPPRWTDKHHIIHWADGGGTGIDNMTSLCRLHHRLLHNPLAGWRVRLGADRLPEFIPPPWHDPHQRPRRNHYHPRN